jgi:hypothetical protein
MLIGLQCGLWSYLRRIECPSGVVRLPLRLPPGPNRWCRSGAAGPARAPLLVHQAVTTALEESAA